MQFVRIQSNTNIVVTAGLQSVDMTNPDAHVSERLNIKPAWVGTRTLIKVGSGYYPARIKDWDSVKSLEKNGILTIGEVVDTCPEEYRKEAEEAEANILACISGYENLSNAAKQDKEHKLVDKIEQVKKEMSGGPSF